MRLLLMMAISFMLVLPAGAAESKLAVDELYLYPSLQYFTWEESSGGSRLLKESGFLYGIGGGVRKDFRNNESWALSLRGKLELFGGVVDYSGQTQQSTTNPAVSQLPISTSVDYIGAKTEADAGWRISLPGGNIGPFAGFGYRWWLRDLRDTSTIDRNGQPAAVGGYLEEWQTLYARLGGYADYSLPGGWSLFCEAGGRFPLYNLNSADFPGVGRVDLHPGALWSAFAELGTSYDRFRLTFTYEGMRFSKSDGVRISQTRLLLQPESSADLFGLNIAYLFK